MKTVVLTQPESQVVKIEDVSHNKYYGMSYYDNGRAFLTRKCFFSEPNGGFIWRCRSKVNQGNSILNTGYNTAKEAVSHALQVCYKVFEFDTDQELFAWLSQY